MSREHDPHPSREQLAAFDTGRLAPTEREAIARHLADCPVCGRRGDEQAAHQIAAQLRPHHFLWLTIAALVAVGLVLMLPRPRKPKPPPLPDTTQETDRKSPIADSPPPDPLALLTPQQRVQLRIKRRNEALKWLANNSSKGGRRALVRDTAIQFDKYLGQIEAFQIQLGPQWLDGWPAALLEANLGGFAAYRLSDEQAQNLNIDRRKRLIRMSPHALDRRRATPRVHLSALRFDDGQRLNLRKQIAGAIAYEMRGPAIAKPFAVRLTVMLDGSKRRGAMQWFTDQKLEGRGTLRLLSEPMWPPDMQASRNNLSAYVTLLLQNQPLTAVGCSTYFSTTPFLPPSPIVVFVDLCTADDSADATRHNVNAYVTLLLQNQPLPAIGCSSYFATPPPLIVESDAVAALVETLPPPKKSAP